MIRASTGRPTAISVDADILHIGRHSRNYKSGQGFSATTDLEQEARVPCESCLRPVSQRKSMRPLQQPKDHIYCPQCNRSYSFIRARVTKNGKNFCLSCGAEEERGSTISE